MEDCVCVVFIETFLGKPGYAGLCQSDFLDNRQFEHQTYMQVMCTSDPTLQRWSA